MARLTSRQAAFCRQYVKGISATEAARRAGYSESYANREAGKLVDKPQVIAEIERLTAEIASPDIADAKERHTFWTTVLRDSGQEMAHRIKCSELLGKAQGDFVERVQQTGNIAITVAYVDES